MAAVLPFGPTSRSLPVTVVLPGRDLLTVTIRAIPHRAVIVVVRGEVDSFTGPALRDSLLAPLRHPVPHLIVDLSEVGFFSAAGLNVLITVRKAAVAAGVALSLVAHARPVLLPLHITGLDDLFDVHPDLAHAVFGMGGGQDE